MTQRERLADIINKSRFFSTTEEIVDYMIDNGVSVGQICIDASFGKIVAERSSDPNYPAVYIGVEQNGEWAQDLVVVEEQYHYDDHCEKVNDGDVSVYLFRDDDIDDYTEKMNINVHKRADA